MPQDQRAKALVALAKKLKAATEKRLLSKDELASLQMKYLEKRRIESGSKPPPREFLLEVVRTVAFAKRVGENLNLWTIAVTASTEGEVVDAVRKVGGA